MSGVDDLPPLPAIPFVGRRRSRQLNKQYEAARARYRVDHPLGPVEVEEKQK
jgi:hypothetical protein